MSDSASFDEKFDFPLAASQGPLKRTIRRQRRRHELVWLGLTAPALLFILGSFFVPIGYFLYKSVANPEIITALPETVDALSHWSGEGMPPDSAFTALADDLMAGRGTPEIAALARRLNYHESGYRTLILLTAMRLSPRPGTDYKKQLISIDPRWGEKDIWVVLKQQSHGLTPHYLLAALDLRLAPDGRIVNVDADRAIFRTVFERTFWMSSIITLACLILGFPVAYMLVTLRERVSRKLMFLVLLPLWTSVLVRTLAWMVLFQKHGLANEILMVFGLTSDPVQILYTRFAVYVAMIHILLPFMIISIYSVMRGISPSLMRAGVSLGAHPFRAFLNIYLPQTKPGIGAGMILVSILALGFYITPALVGAPNDQMISYFVAFYTNQSVNWGLASALGVWLLVFSTGLFLLLNKLIGINRLNLS